MINFYYNQNALLLPVKNKYVLNVIIYILSKIYRPKSFVIEILSSIINITSQIKIPVILMIM